MAQVLDFALVLPFEHIYIGIAKISHSEKRMSQTRSFDNSLNDCNMEVEVYHRPSDGMYNLRIMRRVR